MVPKPTRHLLLRYPRVVWKLVSENAVISALTTLTATPTAITTFGSTLGLRPFVADIACALLMTVVWVMVGRASIRKPVGGGLLLRATGQKSSVLRWPGVATAAGLVVLAVVAAWKATGPVGHLLRPHWDLCGTIVAENAKQTCVMAQPPNRWPDPVKNALLRRLMRHIPISARYRPRVARHPI